MFTEISCPFIFISPIFYCSFELRAGTLTELQEKNDKIKLQLKLYFFGEQMKLQ